MRKQVTVPNGIKIRVPIRVGAALSETLSELPALFTPYLNAIRNRP